MLTTTTYLYGGECPHMTEAAHGLVLAAADEALRASAWTAWDEAHHQADRESWGILTAVTRASGRVRALLVAVAVTPRGLA